MPIVVAGVLLLTRPPAVLGVAPPAAQPSAATNAPPPPDLVSSLNVRLIVDQQAIADAFDTSIPRNFSGREEDPIAAASDDSLAWSLDVGSVVLGSSDGAVAFRIPITAGRVRLVGRLGGERTKRGALGLLQKLVRVDIDETVTFDGAIVGTLRPRLNPDWTVDPGLSADVSLSAAQAEFFGGLVKISLRDAIRERIDAEVSKQTRRLRERLAEDGRIVSAVQQVWDSMHAVVPLAQQPPIWLSWQPVSLAAGVPVSSEETIAVTLGTSVRLGIVVAQAPPAIVKRPLPAPTAPPEDGAISLSIPVALRQDSIEGMPPGALGVPAHIEREQGRVTLDGLGIHGLGDRFTVAVDVTVERDWLPDRRVRLYVSGTPSLDREANRLSLTGARYDANTRTALSGAADFLLEPGVLAWIEQRSVFEILEPEPELLARARAELKLIEASLPEWAGTELQIDSGRLSSVRIKDGWLIAVLDVTGSATLRITGFASLIGGAP